MNKNIPMAFINNKLIQYKISLETIEDCVKKNLEEIQRIKDLFDLKTIEDARRYLTLPPLLFPSLEAEQIIAYLREEEKDNAILAAAEPDLERYKVLLLSAFVYNPSFFTMSWNWCVYVQDKVRQQTSKSDKPEVESDGRIIFFVFEHQIDWRINKFATGSTVGFQSLAKRNVGDIATLEPMENKTEKLFQFRFTVKDNKINYPCIVDIEFVTLSDGRNHKISIEYDPKRPSARSAPVKEINYSAGIDIQRVVLKKDKNDE
ncbi:hypothetical protein FACS1894200_00040 [Spirochaetia bacterium]|nr:hypothetical protein FACS1894200_00040 [Spirochaetia bacterium]